MENVNKEEAPKKRRKWRKRDLLRKGWAAASLLVLLSMIVSMTLRGY